MLVFWITLLFLDPRICGRSPYNGRLKEHFNNPRYKEMLHTRIIISANAVDPDFFLAREKTNHLLLCTTAK